MKQSKIFILLFLLFLIQGTVMPLFPFNRVGTNIQIVPEFVFIVLLMLTFFGSPNWGLKYAVLFGFLTDIVYASVLGVYAFCLTLTVYLVYAISKWVNMNIAMTVLLTVAGVCMLEFGVYVVYLMIGVTDQQFDLFLQFRLLPTICLNAVFTMLIYYPFRRFFEKLSDGIGK
ncbi:rod shape-determining protein MreD [Sporolactobacillus shoreicorticis]|uniref:Rod shape-determining protein MreD n=1 Tax=Sporolactobacillus shoreicorticis TaxID=1923877 RepID=A0ABW5RYT9_9BACL|nr:rod shape-determining protein MreD [Sporolactobacillus shoreicorticis]MCO7127948.1 rod shape-determining protein MreD [Sporolactobacillus shoreicorticis]